MKIYPIKENLFGSDTHIEILYYWDCVFFSDYKTGLLWYAEMNAIHQRQGGGIMLKF